MHLGFALLTLFPGRVGGSEANVRGLIREFSAGRGPERVTLLANAQVAEAYADRVGGPVALHRVRSYRAGDSAPTRLAAMAAAAAAPRLAARDVPRDLDLVHHPVTVPIPRLPGVPTVTTVYDVQHHDLPDLFSRAERRFRRWAYDGAARAADRVVTTSRYSARRLAEAAGVGPERIEVIHMGVDHDRFTPEPTEADARLRSRLPERYVLYPGNLWPHKNHDRLVDALAAAVDPGLSLVLTGQDYGRLDALMERAGRAGVRDRVHHLGYLPADEVPALMRGAEAMVFPSLYEGFGSPPLEAMACGCPVASSREGSLDEMVGDAVLDLDPGSAQGIAAAVDRITGDSQLRSVLRTRGLERAAGFTWADAAARHVTLYEQVCAT